jgi:3-dehydroquinate synthetase
MFNKDICRDWNDYSLGVERDYSRIAKEDARVDVVTTRKVQYSVVDSTGYVLDRRNPAIRTTVGERPVLCVVDHRVHSLYGGDLRTYLEHETNFRGYLTIDGSESAKTWLPVQRICEAAIDAELPRDGVMVGVGGGVTLDITGFAASVFRRGVHLVRVPTSLIGQVDVAVGIKQGINMRGKKSILGAFYPALANINDRTFLATLPSRHIACGIAEIIKMAMVRDADLFSVLEVHAPALLSCRFQDSAIAREVLIRAERLMIEDLQQNLFETELRRLPDFGHTFSPAIENASGWTINHGEAVAMDMLISTALAVNKGLCSPMTFERLHNLIQAVTLPVTHDVCRPEVLMRGMEAARQHRAGDLNLVVPLEIGKAEFIQDVSFEDLKPALALIGDKLKNASIASGSWRNSSPAWNVA